MSGFPRIWVLLGHRRGDNNQLLALAEGLRVPFETRTLAYRKTARAWMKLFPRSLDHLEAQSARWLEPPWPDLVIGIGRRSVPVARWIQQQSGGQSRLVRLGHPRTPNDLFDLVITTRQYPVPDGPNVIRLPVAMSRFREPPALTSAEQAELAQWPRPLLLVSLGGTAPMWRLDLPELARALDVLGERAQALGGTLIVMPSPRSPDEALELVKARRFAIVPRKLRYAAALAAADEHHVTADSVSMISEAILTGKPVGLIPVEMDSRGRRHLAGDPATTQVRDPRRFWAEVRGLGLAGTVAQPAAGTVADPVALAVAAVRERFAGFQWPAGA